MILIISNNPLSLYNNNGRTIATMFSRISKKDIVNFFLQGIPDYSFCDNFVQITNKDAFLGRIRINPSVSPTVKKKKRIKKTLTREIVRELIWKNSKSINRLISYLERFNFDRIFVQLGDSAFIMDIALKISKIFTSKIITFNTEDYYFKKSNFYKGFSFRPFFKMHMNLLKKSYKEIYLASFKNVFLTEDLEDIHKKEFNLKNTLTIYTSSQLQPRGFELSETSSSFSYCGNLNKGRETILLCIADSLARVSDKYFLSIYTPNPTKKFLREIKNRKNVFYRGFVSYNDVINIIYSSFVNLSIDGFDKKSISEYRYAFSTKTADLLCSGKRSFFVTPQGSTTFDYIYKHNVAYVCGDINRLDECIKIIVDESSKAYKYRENAFALAIKNHNADNNALKFSKYILQDD